MSNYKLTGKPKFEGFRELDPNEPVKDEDRVVVNTATTMMGGTTWPPNFLTGPTKWLLFRYDNLGFKLKVPVKAKDLVDIMAKKFTPMLGDSIALRKHSIWRKKLAVIRRPWQDQPLPLP